MTSLLTLFRGRGDKLVRVLVSICWGKQTIWVHWTADIGNACHTQVHLALDLQATPIIYLGRRHSCQRGWILLYQHCTRTWFSELVFGSWQGMQVVSRYWLLPRLLLRVPKSDSMVDLLITIHWLVMHCMLTRLRHSCLLWSGDAHWSADSLWAFIIWSHLWWICLIDHVVLACNRRQLLLRYLVFILYTRALRCDDRIFQKLVVLFDHCRNCMTAR